LKEYEALSTCLDRSPPSGMQWTYADKWVKTLGGWSDVQNQPKLVLQDLDQTAESNRKITIQYAKNQNTARKEFADKKEACSWLTGIVMDGIAENKLNFGNAMLASQQYEAAIEAFAAGLQLATKNEDLNKILNIALDAAAIRMAESRQH
jgi:hypothetical protein